MIMKNTLISLTQKALALLILGSIGCQSGNDNQDVLIFENPISTDRVDELVVIPRTDFFEFVGNIPEGMGLMFKAENGNPVPYQLDDLDGDGAWDELALLMDFGSREKKQIALSFVRTEEIPVFEKRAQAFLGYREGRVGHFMSVKKNRRPSDHLPQSEPYLYLFEGPGWESDVVAYRSYFDRRNGKDIFGKTERKLLLDSIGRGENYHELQPWGMDLLKVGSSLGAGSLALFKNNKLHRLGDTEAADFELLADGPIRAIIKLDYSGWNVEGESYNLTELLSISAGKRYYTNEMTYSGASADTLVTGLANLFKHPSIVLEGLADYRVLATHGVQSENNDIMGMAILIPEASCAGFGKTVDKGEGIVQTEYVKLLRTKKGSYQYFFFTGWELEDEGFKEEKYFLDAIKTEVEKLSNPIIITKK
jgi:hypothetical protein